MKDKKVSKTKQKEQARKDAAKATFSRFFADLYADAEEGRWESRLLPALEGPVRYSCVLNKYAQAADVLRALAPVQAQFTAAEVAPGLRIGFLPDEAATACKPFPPPLTDMSNIKTHYLMDFASVVATTGLDVSPSDTILDMCAAPGGKSFCLLQCLGPRGKLVCNEMSNDRRIRLRRVLKEYIPSDILESTVDVIGFDATRKDAFPRNTYQKVLCDAPCSSERHVLHDEAELLQWSAGRTKASAKRQKLLLANALRTAWDDGGRVVYATCSISKHENDAVVEKVLAKSKYRVKVRTHDRDWVVGEPTTFGWIVLPDTPGRWGPLYFCVLEKDGLKDKSSDADEEEEEEGNEQEWGDDD